MKRIAFACIENSCRSQMAEALANTLYPDRGFEFVSFGTNPAERVDAGAIAALKEEGIHWQGSNKTIEDIEKPDILITMGCGMTCPYVPGARVFDWDLADPKGKGGEAYKQTISIIKQNLEKLMEDLFSGKDQCRKTEIKL